MADGAPGLPSSADELASPNPVAPAEGTTTAPAPTSGIGTKGVRGAVSLIARQGFTQVLSLGAGIALFNLLDPGDYGIYAVVLFCYSLLLAFGDAGLGASLVQQREAPTRRQLAVVFTGQQALVVPLAVVGALVAPFVAKAYDFGDEILPLLWSSCAAFVVTSLGTLSSALLERDLRFGRLGLIGVLQSTTFSGVALALAATGHGASSMGIALLAQSVLGAVLFYASAPYRPQFAWDWEQLKGRLRFGIPVQGVHVVSLAKDSINPVFAGLLLGKVDVGNINFAGQFTAYAAIGLMALSKLYLPLFSRLADDRARLREATERVVLFANTLVAPIAVLTLVFAGPLVTQVFSASDPGKWDPALPLFYIMWASNFFVPTATPLLGLMSALGRPGVALTMGLVWMVSTWIAGGPLILAFGAVGFAVANLLVQLTNLLLFRIAMRELGLRLLTPIVKPWALGLATGVVALGIREALPPDGLVLLVTELAIGGLVYAALAAVVLAPERREFLRLFLGRNEPARQPA
nr:oligosaccharide flippase family protein [Motilibacter deserti]